MAENVLTLQEWLKIAENGRERLEMNINGRNGWTWMEMAGNALKLLEMPGNG